MIRSMTGFGKAELQLKGRKLSVELRSLNSKQLDINIKTPLLYREKEPVLRNEIAAWVKRGKADLIIQLESTEMESIYSINTPALKHYVEQLSGTAGELGIEKINRLELLKLAMRMPDTLSTEKPEMDEEEWELVFKCIVDAAGQLDAYRIQEGEAMKVDMTSRVNAIEENLSSIDKYEKIRIDNIRNRLQQNLQEFFSSSTIDRNRFEQEIIYYLEKLDITEEKVRLKNHLAYFRETLEAEEASGKKLGFISQEIGREINTIGSKANDFNIQKLVVQMKDELEKIKEQSLNVL